MRVARLPALLVRALLTGGVVLFRASPWCCDQQSLMWRGRREPV